MIISSSKVQERSASLENCPWCAAKGITQALRSYRINFQESITLCTSPECLFPLVSRPLEDVLASLVPPESQTWVKRKNPSSEENDVPVPSKRLRSEEGNEEAAGLQNGLSTSQPEPTDMEVVDKSKHLLGQSNVINGYHRDSDWPVPDETDQSVAQEDNDVIVISEMIAPASSPESTGLARRLVTPQKPAPISEEGGGKGDLPTLMKDAPTQATSVSTSTEDSLDTEVAFISLKQNKTAATSNENISSSDKSVSPPVEAVSVPGVFAPSDGVPQSESAAEDMEDPPPMGEGEEAELPLELLCRPCSVDLSQSRALIEVESPSENPTKPARDHEDPVPMERKHGLPVSDDQDVIVVGEGQPRNKGRPKPRKKQEVKLVVDSVTSPAELVPVSSHLFWKNEKKLCWLDSLMVAIVNCQALKVGRPERKPRRSVVWELCTIYDRATALIAGQQSYQDGVLQVPAILSLMVADELQALRKYVFEALQPKLRCKLGKEESPVFAMPLLLKMDSWAEPYFQLHLNWEFQCCKNNSQMEKKTLTTFPEVLPDWHPLNASHKGRCRKRMCQRRGQTRVMRLQSVPPVFAMHFEQGLPDNDVTIYSFNFKQKRYCVTIVIQYDPQLQHFVTWIRKPDGSWLEFDDLKHPVCVPHSKLTIPAKEIHIVFWERDTKNNLHTCSSTVDLTETDSVVTESDRSLEAKDFLADESVEHNDTVIVDALTASDTEDAVNTTVAGDVNASIGSTTLLDTFEGLSHSDIVTLTLVEVAVDSEGRPLADASSPPPNRLSPKRAVQAASPAPENHLNAPETTCVTTPEPVISETPSQPLELILPSVVHSSVVEVKGTPAETKTPMSPIRSPKPLPAQPLSERKAVLPPPASKKAPLSNVLAKQSSQVNNFMSTPKPQAKPKPYSHSTANPQRRPQPSRPPLTKEVNEALPCKAAEMYGGFCFKSTINTTPPQSTPPIQRISQNATSKVLFQGSSPSPLKPTVNPRALSMTSLPSQRVTELPKISSKKHGSRPTKVPPGLQDTEALRLKLLKKLKAKKKKLEKLNQVLGHQGSTPQPDTTNLESPYQVSSSTSVYDSPAYDEFFADLLSPATTVSNLSPDSTGFVEMVTNGQEGSGDMTNWGNSNGGANQEIAVIPQLDNSTVKVPVTHTDDNFLEEFISGTSSQQTEMQTEALSALDLFF